MESQGKLYDMQHKAEYANQLTYRSPVTGNRVGISYLKPETKEDLELRRLQSQIWAKSSGGMLGRSPDYMNTVITAFASAAEIFSLQDSNYTANMQNLYNEAMEKDLCFTHTFINPQVNRSSWRLNLKNLYPVPSPQSGPFWHSSRKIIVKLLRTLTLP